MKIEKRNCGDVTLIGYLKAGKYLEIVKCNDGKTFYRVDNSGRTVSSVHRTKAAAEKAARNYIARNFK